MKEGRNVKIIEWHDMDKKKFYGYGLVLGVSMRVIIYPLNLIKTRLQAQNGVSAYRGTFDAMFKIGKREGIRGFYKGFPISLFQVLAGQLYITTYETTKQTVFNNQHIMIQHLLGGFMASTVSQTIMVPVDIISQYQQMSAAQKKSDMALKVQTNTNLARSAAQEVRYSSSSSVGKSVFGQAYYISQYLLRTEGVRGLYRGYSISLCTYGLNSGFYWGFYYMYSELLGSILPKNKGKLQEALRIGSAGIMGSTTAIILTNPLDVVRTRYQLQVKNDAEMQNVITTYRNLIKLEGYRGLTKGMTARIAQSSFSSWVIILGYEYVKRKSLKSNDDTRHSDEDVFKTDFSKT